MLDINPSQSSHRFPTPPQQPLDFLYPSFTFDWTASSSGDLGRRGPLGSLHNGTHALGEGSKYSCPAPAAFNEAARRAAAAMPSTSKPSHHPSYSSNSNGVAMPDARNYVQGKSAPYLYQDGSRPSSRARNHPDSPTFLQTAPDVPEAPSRKSSIGGNSIVPYLQMPSTISSSKGSLAEFAAQITCLFWFESSTTLQNIEESKSSIPHVERPIPEAFPALGFLKWVTTILSTTQVAQNVILLALLFIYRLKKQNPAVKGKPGSEFRLLTVALMLGNKFLDDNTYTNKTWAEVSGISVQEIHVMEVEFLSHMKYNLYTSKEEWNQWHQHLNKFWQYFNQPPRNSLDSRVMGLRPPTLQIPYALPSPPASNSASPPFASAASPSSMQFHHNTAMFPPPHLAPMMQSPAASAPDFDSHGVGRKRSWDAASNEAVAREPQAKRPYGAPLYQPSPGMTLPSLPGQPYNAGPTQSSMTMAPMAAALQHANPTGRNAPVFFPPQQYSWPAVSSSGTHTPSIAAYASALDGGSARGSPYSSPVHSNFPSATIPPNQLSPSHFLQHRKSPYRPVQNIRTLLVPPPSASLQNPSQNISHEQMHWQPLSKSNNEFHRGLVPYIHREAWPETLQPNQWPSLVGVHQRS